MIYHVGISGGKDSTATFLYMLFESEIDRGQIVATFCDTGNEDAMTYAYIAILAKLHPIEFIKPPLDFWELVEKKQTFPSARRRFCTQLLKVAPSIRFVDDLKKRGEVVAVSGIRRGEGTATNERGNLSERGYNELYDCPQWLPIYEWSIEDVRNIHKRYLSMDDVLDIVANDPTLHGKTEIIKAMVKNGIPRNPLYDAGASRVGCFPCIAARKAEIKALAKHRPERVSFIAEVEAKVSTEKGSAVNMFHANTVPERFRSVPFVTADGHEIFVTSIADVAEWSRTARGGKQYEFDFGVEACDYKGACE